MNFKSGATFVSFFLLWSTNNVYEGPMRLIQHLDEIVTK